MVAKLELYDTDFITVSQLRAHATKVVSAVIQRDIEAIITKFGKPVAVISPIISNKFNKLDVKITRSNGKK